MSDKARIKEAVGSRFDIYPEWEFAGKHAAPTDIEKVNDLWGKPRKWRFDFAIPSKRIAWEIEGGVWTGGRHNRAGGFLGDMDKYNTAVTLGWQVIRSDNTDASKEQALQMIRLLAHEATRTNTDQEVIE